VHACYVEYLMNPFNNVGVAKIESEQFDRAVDNTVMSFNQEV